MTATRRLLVVVGCIACLLVVAATLPAADPRIDVGPASGQAAADSSIETNTTDQVSDTETETPTGPSTGQPKADGENSEKRIRVDGTVAPGEVVEVTAPGVAEPTELRMNGEPVGQVSNTSEATVTIPAEEEVTFSLDTEQADNEASENEDESTVKETKVTDTTLNITFVDRPLPGRQVTINVTHLEEPVEDVSVSVDGESRDEVWTDTSGQAEITLSETAGEVNVSVQKDIFSGNETVSLPEPSVEFTRPILIPGLTTPVKVTAGGEPVQDAAVSVEGYETQTDDDGVAKMQLPIADEVTVTTTLGEEEATASVSGIYLRTTLIFVVIPGLVIGGIWTYLKLVQMGKIKRRHRRSGSIFIALAGLLGSVSAGIGQLLRSDVRFPNIGKLFTGLNPLGAVRGLFAGGLSLSLGGLLSIGSIFKGSAPSMPNVLSSSDSDDSDDSEGSLMSETAVEQPADETAELSPRDELRLLWHAFLDRLNLQNRETLTPGQVARRAVAVGYPVRGVRRLLRIFRTVEYGSEEPSDDTVAQAREAAQTLSDHEPEEGSS